MLRLVAYLLLIMPISCFSQVFDDFSDGDFTDNPAWSGTNSMFIVNNDKQLQLNAESAGNAELFCDETLTVINEMEWHFWLREAFAPSSKNFTDVYLCDNYFVRFGEAGSNDVVELQRVDGDNSVSICRGTDTFIASAFSAYFKVTRDAQGLWKIFVDKTGTDGYILETQGVDDVFEPSGRFGIQVTFSASNVKKVYLDDVYFGPLIVDTQPPSLVNLTVLKYNKIQLDFDELVDETEALDRENYHINNIGVPMYVEFYANNHSCIILSYSKTIEEGVEYILTINKIQDIEGNVATNIQYTFVHNTIHENDIVINEIMTDPEPVVGLPPLEYVELFNTTQFPINLLDWTFIIGTNEKLITQDIEIQPLGFLILCKETSVEQLSQYGECLGFSSFSIVNGGVYIALKDNELQLISDVEFSILWYDDSEKTDGGWSLEQIDPFSPCAGASNWHASCHHDGGTPGAQNSVYASNPVEPRVDYVNMLNDSIIQIVFDQKMDANTLLNPDNYLVIEFDAHPVDAYFEDAKTDRVTLVFEQDFSFQTFYNLFFFNALYNCSGVPLPDGYSCGFGLPGTAVRGDVVINEILFDPISPAADYVEIFNNSDKVFNISDLRLGVVKTSFPNPPDTTIKVICSENRQLLPGHYSLLTTKPPEIAAQYDCSSENFVKMESFPSYPNSGATVLLIFDGEIIDIMSYTDDSHYP